MKDERFLNIIMIMIDNNIYVDKEQDVDSRLVGARATTGSRSRTISLRSKGKEALTLGVILKMMVNMNSCHVNLFICMFNRLEWCRPGV